MKIRFAPWLFAHQGADQNGFVQQIKFDCCWFMVSAIRAQLPTPWQYTLKNRKSQDISDRKSEFYPETRKADQPVWVTEPNHKSQDISDRKPEFYPETRKADQPVWVTERFKNRKRNSIVNRFPGIEEAKLNFAPVSSWHRGSGAILRPEF